MSDLLQYKTIKSSAIWAYARPDDSDHCNNLSNSIKIHYS